MGELAVDAAEELDFLFERELGDHGVGLSLNGGRVGHGSLGRRREANQRETHQKSREKRYMGMSQEDFS